MIVLLSKNDTSSANIDAVTLMIANTMVFTCGTTHPYHNTHDIAKMIWEDSLSMT